MAARKVGVFVREYKKLFFLCVTAQIGMKFGRYGGDFAPKTPFSDCFEGLRVTGLQVSGYVLRLS